MITMADLLFTESVISNPDRQNKASHSGLETGDSAG